jgi:hypothetical protein
MNITPEIIELRTTWQHLASRAAARTGNTIFAEHIMQMTDADWITIKAGAYGPAKLREMIADAELQLTQSSC